MREKIKRTYAYFKGGFVEIFPRFLYTSQLKHTSISYICSPNLLIMINTEGFFAAIFKNARENSVIIMDEAGHILYVNKGFVSAFGYQQKDLTGKHFRMLFTEADQQIKKPEREIADTISDGSKADNNYLVHKKGTPLWVMGESVSVMNSAKEKYIVKIIQDIHAQKQLERFLLESTDFLDTIFESFADTSLIILDSGLRILKTNKAFLKMFGLKKSPAAESRLSQSGHAFWRTAEIKKQLTDILVNRLRMKNAIHTIKNAAGKEKEFRSIQS